MKAITEAIDCWFGSKYPYKMKLFGYSELMTRKDQVMPVTINTRDQVSLDDKFDLITWIRLPGTLTLGNEIEGDDWAFGLKQGVVQEATLRLVIAHKIGLCENLILDILQNFPVKLTVENYQIVSINKADISVDADHESIYNTELGQTAYEKHRFPWNLYALEIPVQFIPCTVT